MQRPSIRIQSLLRAGVYNIVLSGAQAVPANGSTASGTAIVTVDDVANTVFVSLTFSKLNGENASAAHIHCCVADHCQRAGGDSLHRISRGYQWDLYEHIYWCQRGENCGEIRGDITPEPVSPSLTGLGVLALFGARVAAESPVCGLNYFAAFGATDHGVESHLKTRRYGFFTQAGAELGLQANWACADLLGC